MIDLLLLLTLAIVLNWSVVDIYFYSIVFDPIRQYGVKWKEGSNQFWKYFRYMLDCPFCFAHWSATAILLVFTVCGFLGYLPVKLHPVLAVVLIPAVARLSLFLRDYSLPPLTNYHASSEPTETEQDQPDGSPGSDGHG